MEMSISKEPITKEIKALHEQLYKNYFAETNAGETTNRFKAASASSRNSKKPQSMKNSFTPQRSSQESSAKGSFSKFNTQFVGISQLQSSSGLIKNGLNRDKSGGGDNKRKQETAVNIKGFVKKLPTESREKLKSSKDV